MHSTTLDYYMFVLLCYTSAVAKLILSVTQLSTTPNSALSEMTCPKSNVESRVIRSFCTAFWVFPHNSILSLLVFWPTTTISGLLKVDTISVIGCSREWKELDYENITGFISIFYTLQYQVAELGDAPALFMCQTRLDLRPHSIFPIYGKFDQFCRLRSSVQTNETISESYMLEKWILLK